MFTKNNVKKIEALLKANKKSIALLAPSFVAEFSYPEIIIALKKLGFDKVVELTFGAKMVNKEYHRLLKTRGMLISSVCPGVVEFIKKEYPKYEKNIIPVVSPMIATAKICRKNYPLHKIIFISPCNFKKLEAENSKYVDYTIDYQQLKDLFARKNIQMQKHKKEKFELFDCFYNDYTKIYPLAGGLSKTAHLKNILRKDETKIIDGIKKVKEYLDKGVSQKIKFLDVNFCVGGCLGGPHLTKEKSLAKKKKRLQSYANFAKRTSIRETNKGWVKKADGISFLKN